MATEYDFILRPVMRGMCKYESLLDGTVSLEDIAIMNDYIDVLDENDRRCNEANA
jgi:hypothetical protein